MQLQLAQSENGTTIPIHLKPRARHNAIEGVRSERGAAGSVGEKAEMCENFVAIAARWQVAR